MPDEIKSPSSPPPEGEPKPTADKPAVPGGVKATASGSVQSDPKTPPESAAASPSLLFLRNPHAAARPLPPNPRRLPNQPRPTPTPWDSPMIAKFKGAYGSGIEPLTYAGQNYMVVDRSLIPEILQVLRNEEQFDYCVDHHRGALPEAREAIRCGVGALFLCAQRAHPRDHANSRMAQPCPVLFPSGRPPTGWSAKSSTCLASSLTGIPT